MIQDNRENEASNNVKGLEASKQLKATVGVSTPKSVSRPTSSKSTTKSLSTPKNLFSPGPSVSGRDAAKFAKLQGTAERIRKVQNLKEKWAKDKEVSAQVNKEKRAHELRRLQDEADAAAAARKKAIDAERTYELLEKQREKELLAASLEERTQLARDLQEKAKAKRRISMFLNGKLRSAAAKKDTELKAKAQQEYINELSDRRTDYLQLRQAKIREEQGRRDSMMNRTLMAQKHREAEQEMERKAAEEEAALLDMRHLNFQDDMKFKQELDKRRRESMMSRTEMARKHREAEQAMEKKAADEEAALLETRHLNFQDDAKAKQELEKRRRESMMSRTQMAQKHREAEQEMEKKAADEESALLEMRHLNFQDDVQFKQELDKRRRDSMMGRTEMARKHREVEQEMERQAAKEEAALLETRQFNFQDDAKARLEEEQQRRMSMAGRLDHWREEKRAAQTEVYATRECEKDLLRSRQLDHQDMQEYKKSLVARDRQSLAGRLQKWREQKEDPGVKVLAAAVERELQEQELEDVRAYRVKLEQERRESLAYRLEKARKDKTFEAGQTALKAIVEEEERKLADFDRQDVRQYREKLAEDRRRSIQWRNEAESRDRRRQAAEKDQVNHAQHEDVAQKQEDWRAVKAYQAAQRAAERTSLAGRIAEAHRQKELDLERHRQAMDALHMDLELRRLDHLEMREFREEERVRSRRSIALRLASWKDDKLARERERAKEMLVLQEQAIQCEQDREDLQAAKLALGLMERQAQLTSCAAAEN